MTRIQSLERLGTATGHAVTQAEYDLYLERLKPYSETAVAAGCKSLESSATFFPKLSEVLDAVKSAAISVTTIDDRRNWVQCAECQDIGYLFLDCQGGPERSCGRSSDLRWAKAGKTSIAVGPCRSSHAYVTHCRCRAMPANV